MVKIQRKAKRFIYAALLTAVGQLRAHRSPA